ncbi:MAG: ATP-binding cassette domain-containing protein, partial [Caulobacteraceae bacterium]|nr:ATP-binding cassette domain-containing protein [Caulobacteraceae bacterium]
MNAAAAPGSADGPPVLAAEGLVKHFKLDKTRAVTALDQVSMTMRRGTLTALVGPDGAGKTTLIRLAAGLMKADAGTLKVLGFDVAADPQSVQDRIGYMPQKFGLYEDLSVQENLDLYADLHGVSRADRKQQYPLLLEMTALAPFTRRLAGQLSGGMKQKLGLACTLVRTPELLLLDEPTVGVDPLSRRELWEIIDTLVRGQGLPVLVSTAYLDEAERCDHAVVLHEGKVLAQGPPAEIAALAEGKGALVTPRPGEAARALQARLLGQPGVIDASPESGKVRLVREPGAADAIIEGLTVEPVGSSFEDGFMLLLRRKVGDGDEASQALAAQMRLEHPVTGSHEVMIEVSDLVRRFGDFVAVDHVSFQVGRGQIFGLLGPN